MAPGRGRASIIGRLLRGLLAVAVVFATLEASARLVLSRDVISERVRGTSSAAWRLDWINRHRDGVEIYYSFDVYHPTRGWALKPDLRDADPYGPGSLNSNSAGMRGVREFSTEPADGMTRIVLLGDSFAFGEEVADSETFAHRLQELLPQVEVLNLGVHGYGHDQMLVYLREEGLRYHPDIVLLGFVQDDMQRNMLSFRDYAKPRFELADGALELRSSPVPAPDEVVAGERYRSRFLDLVDMVGQAALWRSGVNQRRMEAVTAALLDEIAEASAAGGAATAFFYLPHSEELTNPDLTLDAERFFTDYCDERDALCLNLRPTFRQRMAHGFAVKTPGHWQESGHQLVAEALAVFLAEKGLVPS
ncbi:MAG: hypothetical protein C3F15_10035 [Holophagae bacterium]|nr:MAG: hypothetical protein C3F15_10035 [Holophagae bacterium]